MTYLLLDLNARYTEAEIMTRCPVDQQHQIVSTWQQRYGLAVTKQLQTIATALLIYPSHPEEFRKIWAADNVTDADIRLAVQRLTDEQIRASSRTLQLVYVTRPAGLGITWTLIIASAGAA